MGLFWNTQQTLDTIIIITDITKERNQSEKSNYLHVNIASKLKQIDSYQLGNIARQMNKILVLATQETWLHLISHWAEISAKTRNLGNLDRALYKVRRVPDQSNQAHGKSLQFLR